MYNNNIEGTEGPECNLHLGLCLWGDRLVHYLLTPVYIYKYKVMGKFVIH